MIGKDSLFKANELQKAYADAVQQANKISSYRPFEPLAMRLIKRLQWMGRYKEGDLMPWTFLDAAHIENDEIAVFVVLKGKPITLRDDAKLFPSDKLITAISLLE